MKKRALFIMFSLVVLLLAACAPAIVVQNNSTFPVRVVVAAGDTRSVLSPSPGESSSMEAPQGTYRATVIPDTEWIEYAKLQRQMLNERLKNADQLSGPELLQVVQQLKDVAARMQAYEQAAGSSGSCSGALTEAGGGLVTVNAGADGALTIICQ